MACVLCSIAVRRASGIPYGIGLIKNKYIGRTFIAPDHRVDQVKIKLSAVESAIKGKSIVLVDDSIVRGTTSGQIVRLLKEAGAREIPICVFPRLRSYTPAITGPISIQKTA